MLIGKFVHAKKKLKVLKTKAKRQAKKIKSKTFFAELKAMHVIDTDFLDFLTSNLTEDSKQTAPLQQRAKARAGACRREAIF